MPFNCAVYLARYTRLRGAAYFVSKLFVPSYYFTYLNKGAERTKQFRTHLSGYSRNLTDAKDNGKILLKIRVFNPPSTSNGGTRALSSVEYGNCAVAFPRIPSFFVKKPRAERISRKEQSSEEEFLH